MTDVASDAIELQPASHGGMKYAGARRQSGIFNKGVRFVGPLDPGRTHLQGVSEERSPLNAPAAPETAILETIQLGDGKGGFEFIGEELKDGAPIWRVYRDEITNHDKTVMLDEWNRILDVLLIFAGLFSAVVTAFTIVSYTLIQPDQNDRTATALYALALSLNSTAAKTVPLPPSDSGSLAWVRGINILWFTSLILALTAALLSILAKQWLVEYGHRIAGRPKFDAGSNMTSWKWASMRLFFNSGLTNWHTAGFVTEFLPLILHLALFLFLVGLAMFIWTVDRVVAWVIIGLTISVMIVYVVFTLLPLLSEDCPTSTPLRKQIHKAVAFAISGPVIRLAQRFSSFLLAFRRSQRDDTESSLSPNVSSSSLGESVRAWEMPENEPAAVDETLRWLINVSGSENATKVAFQAIGCLSVDSTLIPGLRVATSGLTALGSLGTLQTVTPSAVEVIRAIRSDLLLRRGSWELRRLGLDIPESMFTALQHSYYPDARLLVAAMAETEPSTEDTFIGPPALQNTPYADIMRWRALGSTSLPATARMLIHCDGSLSTRQLLYLLVFLKRGLHRTDCEKIFSVFSRELGAGCNVSACSGSCIVSLVGQSAQSVYREDRALVAQSIRRSDIIASLALTGTISYVVNSDVFNRTTEVHGTGHLLKFMSNEKWLPREILNELDIDALVAFILTLPILNTEDSDTLWSVLKVLQTTLAQSLEHRTDYTPLHTSTALAQILDFRRGNGEGWRVPAEIWSEVLNTVVALFFLPMKSVTATDPRWGLAATLAAHLSWLKRDGHDAAWIWNPFLTTITTMLSCTTVADFLRPIRGSDTKPHTKHLSQHCRELKHDWCADLKRLKLQTDDPANYLTQCIDKVLSYPPCTACPNPPAAWQPLQPPSGVEQLVAVTSCPLGVHAVSGQVRSNIGRVQTM